MQCGFEATLVVPVGALLDLLLFKCSLHVERIQYDLLPSSSAPNCNLLAESRVQGGFLQGAVTCGNHLVSVPTRGCGGEGQPGSWAFFQKQSRGGPAASSHLSFLVAPRRGELEASLAPTKQSMSMVALSPMPDQETPGKWKTFRRTSRGYSGISGRHLPVHTCPTLVMSTVLPLASSGSTWISERRSGKWYL